MNIKTILTNYWESIKSYLVTNYQPKGSYSDSGHNHDDRYYTETEIDTKLSTKSNTDHLHDNRYYTETEIDTKLSGKSDTSHNHNSAYLGINATATKATNNANGKELVDSIVKNISINGRTITVTKLDGTTYTLTTQDNNTTYSKLSEFTNDPGFITSSGSCNYATSAGSANSVAWANVSGKPTSYTPSSHTHDDRYYTENEIDTKLNSKVNTSDLSAVATSGSYNDLLNKPTIPTVNNATLTIQKNGTTVKTFAANASSNVTCDITVPTKISDLTNDLTFIRKPSGLDGQILTQNSNEITSENPIQLLNMVNTEEELENALSSTPLTLRDVFDTWYRFAHDTNYTQNNLSSSGTQAALDAWYFDSSKNAIGNTVNTVPYVGFVSEKTYKNWRIKTKGVGTDSDDDFMSIIVAFMTDSAGVEHTLSVMRGGAGSNGFLGSGDSYAFALVLDFQNNWSNPKILAGIRKSEFTGSPWSAGAHIEVTRNGDTIVAKTSQFGSDVLDKTFTYSMPTSQGSLSLTDYTNIRLMLGNKARIGFGMCSQPGYFVLEETEGIFDNTEIYDVINNKVYSYDDGWTEKGTVSGSVLNLSRVYNEKTDKLFYYKDDEAIRLNTGIIDKNTDCFNITEQEINDIFGL